MKKIELSNPDRPRILIRGANWVGDAIMTTPVVRAVKKNFPHGHVTILVKPWVAPVFQNNPFVDEILIYDDKGRHKKGWGTIRLSKDLRRHKFDLAVLMQNAFEAALITWLAGIPQRLGYDTDARGLLLNPCIPLDPNLKKVHLIDYYRGILRGAGLVDDGRTLDLFLGQEARVEAGKILQSHGHNVALSHGPSYQLSRSKPIIAINPGATGGTAKRWFPERFAALAKKLSGRFKVKIFIFGGPGDYELGEKISVMSGGCCINLAGRTTLSTAFALIERCSLFITNDSGLMHAAAALGVNQVAIIGSTNPVTTPPSNLNSTVVRVPVPCSPCMKPECRYDHHQCMDKISVEMVYGTAMDMVMGMDRDITMGAEGGGT
ncbi:MAG: lipopolysaccharide heptosyltransferase II [Desulfobacterium sp.]|jgi:heptosyltransferase-2|nr:lipopolysaccharide heptosyltransferase II [Desulfobacterium sp.]